MGRIFTAFALAGLLCLACATSPSIERSDFRWKGSKEPSYKTFDMHRGKCEVYGRERMLKRTGRTSWKHFYECMDDHGWEAKD